MKKKNIVCFGQEQVIKIFQWLTKRKFPKKYASNLGGLVNVEDCRFYSFKSHACHVFIQILLSIFLRGMASHTKWDAITKLCTSFRAICSRVLHMDGLLCLQTTIFETICNLEKVFQTRFFDSM